MVKTVGVRNGPIGQRRQFASSSLPEASFIQGEVSGSLARISAQLGDGGKRVLCEDAGVDHVRATINEYQ